MHRFAIIALIAAAILLLSCGSKTMDDRATDQTPTDLPKHIIGKDGAPMVLIPAGEFQMGSDDGGPLYDHERPAHTVYLDAFYMDVYEVTNAQYRKFVDATGHREPEGYGQVKGEWQGGFKPWSDKDFNGDDQPVVCVSWYDAVAYCEWAGKRLPTEAEWEKAARGGLYAARGGRRKYPWGDRFLPTNLYGVYDMAGSVLEWCADWYDDSYYARSPRQNPPGPDSGTDRVLRGGSRPGLPGPPRVPKRYFSTPTDTSYFVGFRCVASRSD